MTEAEWLACEDPRAIIEYQRYVATDRKMRVFVVAACRKKLSAKDHVFFNLLEQLAEGDANSKKIAAKRKPMNVPKSHQMGRFAENIYRQGLIDTDAYQAAINATWYATSIGHPLANETALKQSHLLRDIFGNPFRPVALDPSWISSTVKQLAEAIYDERAFDRMPILADAIKDAGCSNQDILQHCRSGGEHVRGCWVVDLLLGKE